MPGSLDAWRTEHVSPWWDVEAGKGIIISRLKRWWASTNHQTKRERVDGRTEKGGTATHDGDDEEKGRTLNGGMDDGRVSQDIELLNIGGFCRQSETWRKLC